MRSSRTFEVLENGIWRSVTSSADFGLFPLAKELFIENNSRNEYWYFASYFFQIYLHYDRHNRLDFFQIFDRDFSYFLDDAADMKDFIFKCYFVSKNYCLKKQYLFCLEQISIYKNWLDEDQIILLKTAVLFV